MILSRYFIFTKNSVIKCIINLNQMPKDPNKGLHFHTQKRGFGRSCKNCFKSFDIYGEQIQLSYQGSNTFNTTPGALVSLFILFIGFAYGAYRGFVLITLNDTNVSNASYLYDLDQLGAYYPSDYGFDLSFGIGTPLDPTLGYQTVNFVDYYYTS